MSSTDRRSDRGRRNARRLLHALGEELRTARLSAGLSQRELGRAAGLSGTQIGRIERADVMAIPFATFVVLFTVLGQRLSARPYPEGPPLRDIAHVRLLTRLQTRLPEGVGFRTEVPVLADGDLRAWDAEIEVAGQSCKVEAETALHDLQATDRRIGLKLADSGADRVILLVADSQRNRLVLRASRELLRDRYPLDKRAILTALAAGRCPPESGVVML